MAITCIREARDGDSEGGVGRHFGETLGGCEPVTAV